MPRIPLLAPPTQSLSSEDIHRHLLPDQPPVSAIPIPGWGGGRWRGFVQRGSGRMSRRQATALSLRPAELQNPGLGSPVDRIRCCQCLQRGFHTGHPSCKMTSWGENKRVSESKGRGEEWALRQGNQTHDVFIPEIPGLGHENKDYEQSSTNEKKICST